MQLFPAWFGFASTAIGVPPTERQIRGNRLAAAKVATALSLVCLLLLAPFLNWAAVAATPWVSLLLLPYAAFMGIMLAAFTDAYGLASLSAMSPYFCPQVESWADAYPDVRAHIAAINRQHRQIAMCDYYFMRAWVEEQEAKRRSEEAQQACKTLHGIGTP